MIFVETPLRGAYVLEPQRIEDDRGFFARVFCRNELTKLGLKTDIAQTNMAFSHRRGTLRGLHFQQAPYAEVKIVRCTKGAIYDVIVDLRPESPSFKHWFGAELSESNRKILYVPEGFAQGYLTLTDGAEMYYSTSEIYHPEAAFGIRYNDPEFGIVWPAAVEVMSQQDRGWPDYSGYTLVCAEKVDK
jgi:dTDP-4-dehydrorhamnose 3,5-epimerase